jgi:hypothetical protein
LPSCSNTQCLAETVWLFASGWLLAKGWPHHQFLSNMATSFFFFCQSQPKGVLAKETGDGAFYEWIVEMTSPQCWSVLLDRGRFPRIGNPIVSWAPGGGCHGGVPSWKLVLQLFSSPSRCGRLMLGHNCLLLMVYFMKHLEISWVTSSYSFCPAYRSPASLRCLSWSWGSGNFGGVPEPPKIWPPQNPPCIHPSTLGELHSCWAQLSAEAKPLMEHGEGSFHVAMVTLA